MIQPCCIKREITWELNSNPWFMINISLREKCNCLISTEHRAISIGMMIVKTRNFEKQRASLLSLIYNEFIMYIIMKVYIRNNEVRRKVLNLPFRRSESHILCHQIRHSPLLLNQPDRGHWCRIYLERWKNNILVFMHIS